MNFMQANYSFPFGEPVNLVLQPDRTPKRVFVLGVYASAVHARWVDTNQHTRIQALAVASEPYIFWRGENAAEIINRIPIPTELGHLLPALPKLNGPSGIALDELFLHPLGLERDQAWLCDLVPHSCLNPKQKFAIEREYCPLIERYSLPQVTLPPVPKKLADATRVRDILSELEDSNADTIILLGNEPIKWFSSHFAPQWVTLSAFGGDIASYGQLHNITINSKVYQLLPLVHPRQAARLGSHSSAWFEVHQAWIDNSAEDLRASL